MSYVGETLTNLLHQTAFFNLTWGNYVMILVAFIFLYLAVYFIIFIHWMSGLFYLPSFSWA